METVWRLTGIMTLKRQTACLHPRCPLDSGSGPLSQVTSLPSRALRNHKCARCVPERRSYCGQPRFLTCISGLA